MELESVQHLFIVPEGALVRLPIVALPLEPLGTDGEFVRDKSFTISYLTAGRDLRHLKTERRVPTLFATARIFSGPAFGARAAQQPDRGFPKFSDLKGTAKEGQQIAATLRKDVGKVEHFTGDAASAAELLRDGLPPSFLHIATHAFYLAQCKPWPFFNLASASPERRLMEKCSKVEE